MLLVLTNISQHFFILFCKNLKPRRVFAPGGVFCFVSDCWFKFVPQVYCRKKNRMVMWSSSVLYCSFVVLTLFPGFARTLAPEMR